MFLLVGISKRGKGKNLPLPFFFNSKKLLSMSKNHSSAKEEIDRLKVICAQLFANKTALNRFNFGVYSAKLKRLEYLYCQKNFNAEYKQLLKEVKEIV